jgi:hypothetical protein
MKMTILGLLLMSLAGCAARDTAPSPSQKPKAFAAGVQKFLDDKGGYCLGKPDWPRLVTDVDRRKHKPDALQMPVLEHLGVVSGAPVPSDSTNIQYSLTAAGRKFYVDYPATSLAAAGQAPPRPGDLCVAQLRVLKVTKWTPIQTGDGISTTMVSYTYEISGAAPWTDDPDFRKVFPVVAEILSSGNKLEMMLPLQWTGRAWVAAVPAY